MSYRPDTPQANEARRRASGRRNRRVSVASSPSGRASFGKRQNPFVSLPGKVLEDTAFLLKELADKPLRSIAGFVAFLSNVLSIIGFFGSEASSQSGGPSTPAFLSVFPARVIAFIVIAASIAWSLSTFGIWMTKRQSAIGRIVSHIVTVIAALFLAACIDWIFSPDLKQIPLIVLFFVICGVAFAIFLAKTNYQHTLEPHPEVIAQRAELLASFAISATLFVILRQITGL